jgi:hypothetical protein
VIGLLLLERGLPVLPERRPFGASHL